MIGGFAAYRFEFGVFLLALFLFFAMTGGRVLGDIRDLPHDQKTDTMTIPKKYGIRRASYFLLVNQIIAYAVGLSVYATGLLGLGIPVLHDRNRHCRTTSELSLHLSSLPKNGKYR